MRRFISTLVKLTDINTRMGFTLHTLKMFSIFMLLYAACIAGLFDGAGGFTYAEY